MLAVTAAELGVVSGVITALVGVGGWLVQRRKAQAESGESYATAAATTVASALSLIEPMQRDIADLRRELVAVNARADTLQERVNELEDRERENSAEIQHLSEGIDVLTKQVVELGKTPRWPPGYNREEQQ